MSAYAKKSLKELMDDELERLGLPKEFSRLEKFINSGKKSAKFISYLLKDSQYSIPNDNDSLYETAEIRARHSAVTFLVGLALRNFGDLFNKIPAIVDHSQDCAEHMWLTTSLYHDKAYSSTYVTRPDIDYRKKFLPYLLTDNLPDEWSAINKFSIIYPGTLAYTYNEIEKYDEYAIEYHRENEKSGKEKRDHGILGGVMMFSDLENKAVKQGLTDELLKHVVWLSHNTIFSNPQTKNQMKGTFIINWTGSSPLPLFKLRKSNPCCCSYLWLIQSNVSKV